MVQLHVLYPLQANTIPFHSLLQARYHLENSPWVVMVVFQRVCQNHHLCPHQMKDLECCHQSPNFGDQGVNWEEMVIVFRDGGSGVDYQNLLVVWVLE